MRTVYIKGATVKYADFTQVGEVGENVGEVDVVKGVESSAGMGVESDEETPVKSKVSALPSRLYPSAPKGVESVGEVAPEWMGGNYGILAALKQPMLHGELEFCCNKSRDWSRDKSRDWNASKNGGICWNCAKIVRWNKLRSRVRNRGKSRDWNGGRATQETTQQTTQETTRQTTQQITWNTVRWEIGPKETS